MLGILGIGDAIVDKLIQFDETDVVMQSVLPYKGMFFVASDEQHAYLREQKALAYYAGGSAANTIRCMACLGEKTGFLGLCGTDQDGEYFKESLQEFGVNSHLKQVPNQKTGCSVVMVHEDKDRTQCAKPCASGLLSPEDVTDEVLKSTHSILLEGYVLNRNPKLIENIVLRADRLGVKVYFTLSDAHCVQNQKEMLLSIIEKIDIVFGNEHEFKALNMPTAYHGKTLFVETRGANGVFITKNQETKTYQVTSATDIVNANGAGDGFAGGFLRALHQNKKMSECVALGHEIALKVLKTPLSYLPKEKN